MWHHHKPTSTCYRKLPFPDKKMSLCVSNSNDLVYFTILYQQWRDLISIHTFHWDAWPNLMLGPGWSMAPAPKDFLNQWEPNLPLGHGTWPAWVNWALPFLECYSWAMGTEQCKSLKQRTVTRPPQIKELGHWKGTAHTGDQKLLLHKKGNSSDSYGEQNSVLIRENSEAFCRK